VILIDSNILLRLASRSDPAHSLTSKAIQELRQQNETLCLVPQNLYEFWAVATRPLVNNGLGLTPLETVQEISGFKQMFILHADSPKLFDTWETLVAKYACSGKVSHDARLVADMVELKIPKLLTFNTTDFTRFSMIKLIHPQNLTSNLP